MYKFVCIVLLSFHFLQAQNSILDSLETIRSFQLIDSNNASSGYIKADQYRYLKEYGFSHVISLLPGDQSQEDSIVTSLGMTFTQIEVNWKEPSFDNVQNYFSDMKKYSNEKVFLHCAANMRASAFMFLYRTTQLDISINEAKRPMYEIWNPKENEKWHILITEVLQKYDKSSNY